MILISALLTKIIGTTVKTIAYPFHWIFPKKRFSLPAFSPARRRAKDDGVTIPRIIWQTNFSEKSTFPLYLNYLYNRLMSRSFEYRYVSTEARGEFLKTVNLDFMPDAYEIYSKLTDGAAQADFWRVATLYKLGGVYLDIDGVLLYPLEKLLKGESSLYIGKNRNDVTNYFLATTPGNPVFREVLLKIRERILSHSGKESVFYTTGPMVFQDILKERGEPFSFRKRGRVCAQGIFTNEYFQYMDKPRGKWTHTDISTLIK